MSDFLDLQGAKDLNTDAIHIGAVANSVDPVTGLPINTHVNRVGGTDYTLQGFWNALGPVVMPWTSATGGTLTQPNQAFLHPANGNYYSWGGEFPHVVTPGEDPAGGAGYVPRTDVVLRDELADVDSTVVVAGVSASDLSLRTAESADAGGARNPLGYDPVADVAVGMLQDSRPMDIIRRGSINLAKKFRGIRRNCGLISARGGRLSDAGDDDFAPLITGVQNARGLAAYNSVDGVTAYIDATSRPAEAWELTTATAFTVNSCTIPIGSSEKTKIGDVIKTGGTPVYFGIVTDVEGQIVSVDEWASDGSTVGTPSAPVSVEINPVNKIWCLNAIANLESGGRADTAVVAELGVVNNSQSSQQSYPNGVDMLMMQSLFGGGAAYLARGVSSIAKWLYGFRANGALFNFYSSSEFDAPHAGFRENSTAIAGIKLSNKNTYSVVWNTSDSDVDLSIDKCPMLIGNRGHNLRLLNDTGVISASRQLSEVTPSYLVGAGPGITITMPLKANHVGGHYYELLFINAGSYTISGGDANVNGAASVTITVLERSYHRIVFDGNQWQTF